MANNLSPTIIATSSTPLNTLFLPKTTQLSNFKRQPRHRRLSRTSNNDKMSISISCQTQNNQSVDRRNMLIGLGGMYGAGITFDTLAVPIEPDLSSCDLTVAAASKGQKCCPPKVDLSKIINFNFEKTHPNPVTRVRRPAHLAMKDPVFLTDYKRAISLMKSLPKGDPRSFIEQAKVHCAYCDGSYPILNHQDQRLLVHESWLFASFHRWYLYFFERIMCKLISKGDFFLPYWNWDHPDGMLIPDMFKDIDSPLFNPNRNEFHLDKVVDLSYNGDAQTNYPADKQIVENLGHMYQQMVRDSTKPDLFFGSRYRLQGERGSANKAGTLESSPHNNIHSWTGSATVQGKIDMGAFWSAGRDAIFYCHHANVDRMWSIWKDQIPGPPRTDITDPDYLNTSFVFYDENAKPVRVFVKDSFDTERLGYTYEKQELPWLNYKPPAPAKAAVTADEVKFPQPLNSVIKTKVVRPRKVRSAAEKEEEEEVILINVRLGMVEDFVKFDVYVDDDYDHKPGERSQIKAQFAGSFTSLVHGGGISEDEGIERRRGDRGGAKTAMKSMNTAVRLAITKLLDDIGASQDDAIQVTIVPISGYRDNVIVDDVKIVFVS